MRQEERNSEFEREFPGLHLVARQVALRLVGNRDDSDDIAEEALIRAYIHWKKIRSYAKPWVATVVSRLALDHLRRQRVRVGYSPSDEAVSLDLDSDLRVSIVPHLSSFPRKQRETVILRYLCDYSESDTAKALNMTVGTVKTHSARGRATLACSLRPHVPQD